MKKRLNIFCLLILLVLGTSLYKTTVKGMAGFMLGFESANEMMMEDPARARDLQNIAVVSLRPKKGLFMKDSLYNELSGKMLPVVHGKLITALPSENLQTNIGRSLFNLFYPFITLTMGIIAIVMFIRLIIAINKSQIFTWKNVHRLYKLGGCLMVIFAMELIILVLIHYQVDGALAFRGYEVRTMDALSFTNLLLGLSALLVGEVFAIGLRLKEEQELTI